MHTISRRQQLFGFETHLCFYRTLIEEHPDGLLLVDSAGIAIYANPMWERLLGRASADITGQQVLDYVHPEDVIAVASAIGETCSPGAGARIIEYRCRRRDGGWATVESICQPCAGEAGVLAGLFSRDVTRRNAAQARTEGTKMLEATAQVSGAVAADFAELLVMIGRHADRLLVSDGGTLRDDIRGLRRALDQGRVLVDQLHSFSRIDDLEHRVAVDANDVIADAALHLEQLAGRGAEITFLLGASQSRVGMSRAALERVLGGLVIHAHRTVPPGTGLTIATSDSVSHSLRVNEPAADCLFIDLIIGARPAGRESVSVHDEPTGAAADDDDLQAITVLVRRAGGEMLVPAVSRSGATIRLVLPLVPPPRGSSA